MRCFLKNSPWTTVALATVLMLAAPCVPRLEAATGRSSLSSAAHLGLYVSTINRRLMVIGVTGTYANLGVRFGDQIVAVNGRRVAAEAAFLNRLAMAKRGSASVTLTIARNGRLQNLNVPVTTAPVSTRSAGGFGGGFMNPDLMVMTSQGVMHRDAAERLGLPGTPITGSQEWPEHPAGGGFSGGGFMNPSLMVMTSQGVMHRDAAARLGLPGTPITGSVEHPQGQ